MYKNVKVNAKETQLFTYFTNTLLISDNSLISKWANHKINNQLDWSENVWAFLPIY